MISIFSSWLLLADAWNGFGAMGFVPLIAIICLLISFGGVMSMAWFIQTRFRSIMSLLLFLLSIPFIFLTVMFGLAFLGVVR